MTTNEQATGATEMKSVVCTLTTKEMAKQSLEWQDLRGKAKSSEPIEGGARMTFAANLGVGIEDLANREQRCCAFLNIDTTYSDDNVTVEITTNNPDGLGVIGLLSGLELNAS